MIAPRPEAPRGFTLVELLVVIAIIGLISAVALPVVLPALNERRVSEAARQLQAILAGARDAAIRANAARGIRLLPDPIFNGSAIAAGAGPASVLASNRIIPIEPAPDYSEGLVTLATAPVTYNNMTTGSPVVVQMLQINEVNYLNPGTKPGDNTQMSNPTSWYWNLRQGDKVRFSDSGQYYTIAGPMQVGPVSAAGNSERFLNIGKPVNTFPTKVQYLYVTNGVDDNGNGYVDEAFDGIDNDGDGIIDPMFNGLDDDGDGTIDNETSSYEGGDPSVCDTEAFEGSQAPPIPLAFNPLNYVVSRRPVVSPGARETTLPAGVVIDMTTWNAPMVSQMTKPGGAVVLLPERSRLPVDPYTFYVDIMISPSGQVIQGGAGSSNGVYNALAPQSSQPFYHFWLTEREGVQSPLWGTYGVVTFAAKDAVNHIPKPNPNYGATATSQNFLLPMPKGTLNYTPMADAPSGPAYSTSPVFLTGERRLVTLFLKTGQIVTNSIESFNGYDTNQPFYDAQAGVKESQ